MVGYRETSPSTHNVTDGHRDVCSDGAVMVHCGGVDPSDNTLQGLQYFPYAVHGTSDGAVMVQ